MRIWNRKKTFYFITTLTEKYSTCPLHKDTEPKWDTTVKPKYQSKQ
jgi:hypothetical protein